jgi:hypothetical protein
MPPNSRTPNSRRERQSRPAPGGIFALTAALLGIAPPVALAFAQEPAGLKPEQVQPLVERAAQAEVRAVQQHDHPMRYRLSKESPRLTTVKDIIETRDGDVALLLSVNGNPLSAEDEQREQTRLDGLIGDPGQQRHRKEAEDADTQRALKVLRALPQAFLYQYAGMVNGPAGPAYRLTLTPNPAYSSSDIETHPLTAMTGELWIDVAQERMVKLQGTVHRDVDFGWGILGRLDHGGWVELDQTLVGENQWRLVHLKLQMHGRVLFKTKVFDTVEDQTGYTAVPAGLAYSDAVRLLRGGDTP